MSPISNSALQHLDGTVPGSIGAAAAIMSLNKALDIESANAAALLQALPQPARATSGRVGTQLNVYA